MGIESNPKIAVSRWWAGNTIQARYHAMKYINEAMFIVKSFIFSILACR
jgi:hypothetical protein